jgi:hypothetical protein
VTDLNDILKVDDKFTTATGLPMTEYVPQDYPRSEVVYTAIPVRQLDTALVPLPSVGGAFVAGGYAADLLFNRCFGETKDVDVFFNSKEAFEEMYDRLVEMGFTPDNQSLPFVDPVTKKLLWTPDLNSLPYFEMLPPYTLHSKFGGRSVQLVKIRWYDDVEHVIDSFDFTVVQVGFDLRSNLCFFNPQGAIHYIRRSIVQHRVESRARVVLRLQKYKDKGFKPTDAFVLPPEVTP